MTKTRGQRLYESKHPARIRVVRVEDRHFATPSDVFEVENPVHQVPWRLLTKDCQASWELTAQGHNMFSGESA